MRKPTPIKKKKTKKQITQKKLSRKHYENYLCYFGKRFISKITQKTQEVLNQFESIELVEDIEDIITGDSHLILKDKSQQFLTYGDNQFGQIQPNEIQYVYTPSPISLHNKIQIANIFSGYDHCFAIDSQNDVYSWGLNCKGQLGIKSFDNCFTPTKVKQLSQQTSKNNFLTPGFFSSSILKPKEFIIDIACGGLHTIALSNKNRVFSCGFGQSFALGHGNNQTLDLFKEINFFSDIQNNKITKISAGIIHSGCLVSGTLYVWGTQGTTKHLIHSKPNQVNIDNDVINFEMGDSLTVILTQNKEVYTMGTNIDFQLGYQGIQSSSPQKVNIGKKVTSISCGLNHVIVTVGNNIYGWGSNRFGQINPFSREKFFDCLVEIDWAKQSFVKLIKCSPFSTVFISRYPIKNQKDDHEKNIEEAEKQMFNLQRLIDHTQNLNMKLENQFDELYTTLQSMSIDNNLCQTETTQSNADQKITKLMGQLQRERVFYQNYEIDYNEIIFDKKISHGAFGEIYKATWREHKVAVKTLKEQHRSENPIKDFLSECQALVSLRHPNIVMCHGCCTKTPSTLAIILEYCPNDSLWNLLRNKKGQLSWKKKINIALGISKGMNYLHCFPIPIVHRDLKSLNILIDAYHNPKITDFGWSRFVAEKMTGKVGTYQWMAPEVIKTNQYTEKADVFSFGIILWELASEEPPFKNKQQAAVSLEVVNNDLRPEIPDNCPKQIAKLMKKCWSKDQFKRPSFDIIIKELQNIKSGILEQFNQRFLYGSNNFLFLFKNLSHQPFDALNFFVLYSLASNNINFLLGNFLFFLTQFITQFYIYSSNFGFIVFLPAPFFLQLFYLFVSVF